MSFHTLPCRVIPGMTRGEYNLLRAELVQEQCSVCPYCGQPFPVQVRDQWAKAQATVEHIEARTSGGSSDRANLTAACYSCNSLKSDQPLLAFLLRLHDPQRRRRR
jgi:5-methylcytosine-specific restriction endonuclease McrA